MAGATRAFTVIGGFLGAGKTTLVNRILAEADGVRYAVMVNDFGRVNVDASLIAEHDGRTMALTNGCVCCSLADGFITTMLRLMKDPESFDHVIVEASGVALPDRIMDLARLEPALAPDAIIVLVDAETQAARLDDRHVGEVVAAQIESADIILVTKLDLAGPGALAAAEKAVRKLNPTAAILAGDPAEFHVNGLLGTGAAICAEAGRRDVHAGFHTLTLTANEPVSHTEFERFTAALPNYVIRGKGHIYFSGSSTGFLWQRVGARMGITNTGGLGETSELVLIGTERLTGLQNIPTVMKVAI
ncbi:GTP-binding protein [uncultured Paracoccus sp.]|uniref:CobW family GTP-binding protein n=1 Tax=uncultured Paracoccus sp. TaxID=189685 RepID=UPI002638EF69|nr:CobW family GTP-binding protein [uncultured Paracoccus sp.]